VSMASTLLFSLILLKFVLDLEMRGNDGMVAQW
jgi:hypothetical protein